MSHLRALRAGDAFIKYLLINKKHTYFLKIDGKTTYIPYNCKSGSR